MGGQQRIYKQRIASTRTLAKVFRAMEMIAASRIGAARRAAVGLGPYEKALTQAVAAVAVHTDLDHPLTLERYDTPRVAVLVIASDRGMAGAYSATILRESERLVARLKDEGKEPVVYTFGRRAKSYFNFRGVPIERSWEGESDAPTPETTREIARELLERFLDENRMGGVSEVHLVYTRFVSVMRQVPEVRQMLPLLVVDAPEGDAERGAERGFQDDPSATFPEYEFIPSAEAVLDTLLPLYVESRIHNVLLQSAASELASRQRAMHTATDNAEELITKYTRLANSARQADITQEISEIVGGADALVAG
ncbi:F0F1 ATP synthase subunit gamma [Schaalia hyovaginalis]|uniref:F0F1 ATP synthase subunit gamma n=1 Tax=Schaalia TaxID=2529408 RepID=UPI001F32D9C6|nr:F0F1 ATP synthase subunit gamma [Schaalia hyovaginalis]MCF2710495.1 F0F1 ATP synthase subunit gamma [Schaalia hyovaginalis]MCI6557196.1 F0F1 ATP synthase subunit gamma [Schaalia hyovaginalis]MCI7670747.1 F0F1 ATP synthase subunit gamma [Schaalia hyovaginalis]MDD7553533.1 F0F1 ATP synthase subunit gamma [Schaalia hyovaginalis]MDY3093730.1 F0F1 ATP synthase subunit gamma [Schaalia hyovaginalis]